VLPSSEVWVTVEHDTLTGMIALNGESLEQLYVAPEHVGRGLGSKLLAVAIASRDELALWTFEANARARAFYEAHGFVLSGPASCDNEETEPALPYRWSRSPRPS
jgi:GNAT superfamily N-acetyltransferase